MGTIHGAESTMGSDFDANNRTMGTVVAASNHDSTMRREIDVNMPGKIKTEYDKPWMSKEDRES